MKLLSCLRPRSVISILHKYDYHPGQTAKRPYEVVSFQFYISTIIIAEHGGRPM